MQRPELLPALRATFLEEEGLKIHGCLAPQGPGGCGGAAPANGPAGAGGVRGRSPRSNEGRGAG